VNYELSVHSGACGSADEERGPGVSAEPLSASKK